MEEYAYVLDFLAQGAQGNNFGKKEPVCYAIGDEEFKLFELVPKPGVNPIIGTRVYIGKDPALRDVVDHVKRRIGFEDLTNNASLEMEYVLKDIVEANESRYVKFFNEAEAISMKKHLLEELPGLGKKTMNAILEQRRIELFKSFADLTERAGVKTPEKLIVSRIYLEISDPSRKRYLFVSR